MTCYYKGEPIIVKNPKAAESETSGRKKRGPKAKAHKTAFLGPRCTADTQWWKGQGLEKWLPSCSPEELTELLWHFAQKTPPERARFSVGWGAKRTRAFYAAVHLLDISS